MREEKSKYVPVRFAEIQRGGPGFLDVNFVYWYLQQQELPSSAIAIAVVGKNGLASLHNGGTPSDVKTGTSPF